MNQACSNSIHHLCGESSCPTESILFNPVPAGLKSNDMFLSNIRDSFRLRKTPKKRQSQCQSPQLSKRKHTLTKITRKTKLGIKQRQHWLSIQTKWNQLKKGAANRFIKNKFSSSSHMRSVSDSVLNSPSASKYHRAAYDGFGSADELENDTLSVPFGMRARSNSMSSINPKVSMRVQVFQSPSFQSPTPKGLLSTLNSKNPTSR